MIEVDLPPSQKHHSRRAALHGDTLIVAAVDSTMSKRLTIDVYDLTEIESTKPGCRFFDLLKADGETYQVNVGGLPSCSCTAGTKAVQRGIICKHRLSIQALIKAGALRPAVSNMPPVSDGNTALF